MLYIRKLFTQDLRDGKQIAFPKEPSNSFFSFDYAKKEPDRNIAFTFKAVFEQFKEFDGTVIKTRLYAAGSESRMDGQVKAFIRDELHAKVDDLLIFKTKDNKHNEFEVMFVPQSNIKYYPILYTLLGKDNHTVISIEKDLFFESDQQFPLQQIFYGAPGTGKSHEIKRLTKDESVIRTTFHPDSDYSTFVGCYKPTMNEREDNLSIVELTVKLKEIAMAVPSVSYPCLNFATRYWKSLLKLTPKERENIIVACGFGTTYTAELNKGMSIGQELAGYFKNESIVYRFVKQAFLKAYLLAWKNYTDGKTATYIPVATAAASGDDEGRDIITTAIQNDLNPYNNIDPNKKPNQNNPDEHNNTESKPVETHFCKPVYLIIEEINRGNCAQIFGDLFQLLDRQNNGFSEYPIEADTDLQQEIARAFKEDEDYKLLGNIDVEGVVENYTSTRKGGTLSKDIQDGHILLIPKNLYIWATMNTSDQSLFPIDSAFKRRWEWKYIKITKGKDKDGKDLDWKLKFDYKDKDGKDINKEYGWWDFIQKINTIIASMTSSADKQLGYFFCKAGNDGIISEETFVSKVLFYLWNDVFKDYGFEDASLFQYEEVTDGKTEKNDLAFPNFYNEDGDKVDTERVADFVQKVMSWSKDKEDKK